MKSIIITGASSGLGREYFLACHRIFPDARFYLVARRADRLAETAALCADADCRLVECDLTSDEGKKSFSELLRADKPNVLMLINNAGYGKLGCVAELSPEVQEGMVELNCASLTRLTAEVIPYMERGSSIINVSSIASFAPTPRMTVYSSTKAYVSAFSKGLREELKPKKIGVLAVCPGPMRTEFLGVAEITDENSSAFRNLPYSHAPDVAYKSVKAAIRGKGFYTPGGLYKLYRVLAKLLPHSLVMKLSKC